MKYFHNAEITVFIKPPFDSEEEFKEKLDYFIKNINPDKFKKDIIFKKKKIPGTEEFPEEIITFIYKITQPKYAEKLFMHIRENVDALTLKKYDESLELRIDETGTICMRLDKDDFIQKEKLLLVEHGNCIHIKMNIAAYPCNKETAIKTYEKYLEMRQNSTQ